MRTLDVVFEDGYLLLEGCQPVRDRLQFVAIAATPADSCVQSGAHLLGVMSRALDNLEAEQRLDGSFDALDLVRAAPFDEAQGPVAVGEEHFAEVVGEMRPDVGRGIVERVGAGGRELDEADS
ncbi:MAG: hypothetical protein F4238_19455 [Gemmatimonadetes bacterium]|nr:hypothetical protein [Gemmatimonadota bacterium]